MRGHAHRHEYQQQRIDLQEQSERDRHGDYEVEQEVQRGFLRTRGAVNESPAVAPPVADAREQPEGQGERQQEDH